MTTNVWVEQVSALNGMGCEIFFPQMVNEQGHSSTELLIE